MPRLLIELTGVEYDRLVAYAKTLRRTPQAQAAQIIGDAMEALAAPEVTHDNRRYDVSAEADGPGLPTALPP